MRIIQCVLILCLGLGACKSTKEVSSEINSTELNSEEEKADDLTSGESEINEEGISPLSDSVFAQIQRTPCFGRCGIYTLTVFKSGLIRYKGEKWVEKEGVYEAKVDEDKLKELLNYANNINYFEMEDVYDNLSVTDLPATITSLRNKDGIKTIVNRYDGPKKLSNFETFFDSLFETANWVKIVGDTK